MTSGLEIKRAYFKETVKGEINKKEKVKLSKRKEGSNLQEAKGASTLAQSI